MEQFVLDFKDTNKDTQPLPSGSMQMERQVVQKPGKTGSQRWPPCFQRGQYVG